MAKFGPKQDQDLQNISIILQNHEILSVKGFQKLRKRFKISLNLLNFQKARWKFSKTSIKLRI